MLVAVICVMLPSSGRYFALTKPAPRAGAPARRGGLFTPRTAGATARDPRPPSGARPGSRAATTRAADDAAAAERSRTKKRTSAASVAKGAELARTRAKAASKSRRTES